MNVGDVVTIKSYFIDSFEKDNNIIYSKNYLNVEIEKIDKKAPHPYKAKYYDVYFDDRNIIAIAKRWGVSNSGILAGIIEYINDLRD